MKNKRLENGFIVTLLFALASCGPTQKELEENAKLACLRIGETRKMDGELRVRIISEFGIKASNISFVKSVIEKDFTGCEGTLLSFHPDSIRYSGG